MDQGWFHYCAGSRKKVYSLTVLLSGLLLVTSLNSSVLAAQGVVSLPTGPNGFVQVEFADLAGVTMVGQTVSVDFVFQRPLLTQFGPVWSEVFLQTGPHGSTDAADFPYDQYVVFGPGTKAYVMNEYGGVLNVPMEDWNGGMTSAPTDTIGVLSTNQGWAGADILAYPPPGTTFIGIHYDLVLPNTGQTISLGRITVRFTATTDSPSSSDGGPVFVDNPVVDNPVVVTPVVDNPVVVTPAPDIGTPDLHITGITVTQQTTSAASINWSTATPNTFVEFGTTTAYGARATPEPSSTDRYSARLTSLSSNTTYHYRITSRDDVGNSVVSPDSAFTTDFEIPNLGGSSRTIAGMSAVAYGRTAIESGTAPSGIALLESRLSGTLLSEVAIPSTELMTSGRFYVEVSPDASLNTGVVISNPNSESATITYELRNTQGNIYRTGNFTLKGSQAACDSGGLCNRLSRVVSEAPFFAEPGAEGTMTFTSTLPVSVVSIRGLYNQATNTFLITNQPVIDLSASPRSGARLVPHFAAGDGMRTQLVLVNPTGSELHGRLDFHGSWGNFTLVKHEEGYVTTIPYTVAPNSAQSIVIDDGFFAMVSGTIWVFPAGDDPAPVPLAIVTAKTGNVPIAETGIPVTMGSAFRLYTELSNSPAIDSAVAIANATGREGTVALSLTDLAGNVVANASWSISPWGQLLASVGALLPSVQGSSMQGILRITTDVPELSVVGLRIRYNERQPVPDVVFTAIVPSLENGAPPSKERVFGQIANGDEFSTRIILYSGTAGETSQGNLNFVGSDGKPLILDLR